MCSIKFLLLLLCSCASLRSAVSVKQYDVKAEAVHLYGEDLYIVLQRFRRSPDYNKILSRKMEEMKDYLSDMAVQTVIGFDMLLLAKIMELAGSKAPEPDPSSEPPPSQLRRSWSRYSPQIQRRILESGMVDVEDLYRDFAGSEFRDLGFYRRGTWRVALPSIQRRVAAQNKTGSKYLDEYYRGHEKGLTVSERNHYRDLGFEYAKKFFQTMIMSMGPDETPVKSTQMPGGGEIAETQPTAVDAPEGGEESPAPAEEPATEEPPPSAEEPAAFRRATTLKTS